MLTVWGLLIVIIFMTLIMTKRTTPFTALVLSPVVIGIIAGFGADLGDFALEGVKGVAISAVLVLLALPFGGAVVAQALLAAGATVPADRPVRPARAMDPAGRQG